MQAVIFLDIDGVLQPLDNQDRFNQDMDRLRKEVAVKYDNDQYLEVNKYYLAAVYYDWDKEAVELVRKLCVDENARIVISSNWRLYNSLLRLRDYFRLHLLDQYIVGQTVKSPKSPHYRCDEIMQYLNIHPALKSFVIIDDRYVREFSTIFPDNFVHTTRVFDKAAYEKAVKILRTT